VQRFLEDGPRIMLVSRDELHHSGFLGVMLRGRSRHDRSRARCGVRGLCRMRIFWRTGQPPRRP